MTVRGYDARMDITIGFVDVPRELTIAGAKGDEDAIRAAFRKALEDGSGVLPVEDDKGRTHLIRADKIAYVTFGAAASRHVGFIA